MDPVTRNDLGENERRWLLDLARTTIAARFSGPTPDPSPPVSGPLLEHRGAFVTLTIDDELRGCIGHVVGVAPLWCAVRDNAISAAFRDPRFPALSEDEFRTVRIEISALSPLVRIHSLEDVEIGRDGILVERGTARGLLLPQVATSYGWDREAFLDHTCRKAGLEPGQWQKPDVMISTFSAEVFSEE
ncbi:MAG: AmmeMemoRadiSam system protein A [Thermoanaerobaculales bacterium]